MVYLVQKLFQKRAKATKKKVLLLSKTDGPVLL